MEWKKNDIVTVEIRDISDTGEGIGKTDGFTWFIKDTVIGDRVEAAVMKLKKHYGYARLLRVLEPSAARVVPRCPSARSCGGCQLQAMSYQEQLRFKERKVLQNLERIGGFSVPEFLPIIGMEDPWRYRNKAQFPFGRGKDGRILTGFYAGRTHTIIEQEDCLLGVPENGEILRCIRQYMEDFHVAPYDETTHTGLVRHVLIRKAFCTGELMVCLVINGNVKELRRADELVRRLCALYPGTDSGEGAGGAAAPRMASVSCSINRERTNVIMGKEIVNLYGPGCITDAVGNVRYRISPLSFYQVNPVQTARLYETALEFAGLTGGETVWDLYCGIGTISLFLAQKARKVCGVEIVPQAIEDARANAALNDIRNAEFFVGKAEEVLPAFYERHRMPAAPKAGDPAGSAPASGCAPEADAALLHPDVIVVDPPRKGCDTLCLDTILKMAPPRVVYVSCDSATLARDLKYLCSGGYQLEKVRPVDMFPNSVHVETVCLLSQRRPDATIDVNLDISELEVSSAETKATYEEIKSYVLKETGLRVTNLYIAQVKRECGIVERENYNLLKSENSRVPQCPEEKRQAILLAFKHFQMI